MTEGFLSPPPAPDYPGAAGTRQEVTDTVHRIMGEGVAAPTAPGRPAPQGRHTPGTEDASTTDVAKDQAGQVAETTKQAGAQVAGTVADQAGQVTAEAGRQAKQLLSQARSEVTEQAAATQQRVADGLRSLADELAGWPGNSEQDGLAADLARQAADKAHNAAGWLADRDPGSLLDEVRSFARRKPGHLPGDRRWRRCPGRPVDPRPDRAPGRAPPPGHRPHRGSPTIASAGGRPAGRRRRGANRSGGARGLRPDRTQRR